jgi:hypothetical protein
MANKMARIAWAVMIRGEVYQPGHAPMLAGKRINRLAEEISFTRL